MDLLSVARTDSEAATLLTSTIDHRDHSFILGSTNSSLQPLHDLMVTAESTGIFGDELQAIEDVWISTAGIKLFEEAVVDTINAGAYADKVKLTNQYLYTAKGKSNSEARAIAKGITGVDVYWNWDSPRTREGFYRYRGGTKCAIMRAVSYAPYTDCLWMESKKPDYSQAVEFAKGVHAALPEQKLAYNLSPSFNWKGMSSFCPSDLECGPSC